METGAQALPKKSKLAKWILIIVAFFFLFLILACLGTRAVFNGGYHPRGAIFMEISQLDQAMADYRFKANAFPPCMGDADEESRTNRFYTHVIRVFPRYIPPELNADGVRNYLDMREQILTNFKGKPGSWYDLDTMDQAEALVFWLSGFPMPRVGGKPTGSLLGQSKVFGFCSSPMSPFFDVPGKPMGVFTSANGDTLNTPDRSSPGFQFDEARLIDQDGDGWLEYIPMGISSQGLVAPYVYFDAEAYTEQKTPSQKPTYRPYPSAMKGMPTLGPANDTDATAWGTAVPYATALPKDANSQLLWANPRKFQIICAGMDNRYGLLGPTPKGYTENMPKVYPEGIRYDSKGADNDNLTNFSDGRQLGDAQ